MKNAWSVFLTDAYNTDAYSAVAKNSEAFEAAVANAFKLVNR